MKLKLTKGRIVLAGITLACVLVIVLLRVFRPDEPTPEPPDEQAVAVTVIHVEPRTREDRVSLPGRVEAWSDVQVAVEQAGRVTALHVDEGARVAAGDPLLQIDGRSWQAALDRAAVQAADAQRDLERLRELRATGAVSVSELDAMESRARLAAIALDEARLQVERCAPVAPIAGTVDRRLVSVGEHVQPGQPVFRLVDAERVKIRFHVPERDIAAVRPGDRHRFRLDAVADGIFTGAVHVAAQAAEPGGHAFRVELEADNAAGDIRPGMIAQIDLRRGTLTDAIILPIEAIVPLKGETVVYTVEDSRAVRRVVRIGGFLDTDVIIRSGIASGDAVIVDGNRAVLDGTRVRVEYAPTGDRQAD